MSDAPLKQLFDGIQNLVEGMGGYTKSAGCQLDGTSADLTLRCDGREILVSILSLPPLVSDGPAAIKAWENECKAIRQRAAESRIL